MGRYRTFKYSEKFPNPTVAVANDAIQAIGEVTIFFGYLEEQISAAITYMTECEPSAGRVLAVELPFAVKLRVFAELLHLTAPEDAKLEDLDELLAVCTKAEELRNTVTHSMWVRSPYEDSLSRTKFTAKLLGSRRDSGQVLHVWQMMEITSYCAYAAECVDDFMSRVFGLESGTIPNTR